MIIMFIYVSAIIINSIFMDFLIYYITIMYMYVYNIVVSGNLQISNHYNYEEDFSKKPAIFTF